MFLFLIWTDTRRAIKFNYIIIYNLGEYLYKYYIENNGIVIIYIALIRTYGFNI